MMKPGDSLSFLRRDGGVLQISEMASETFSLRCTDDRGHMVLEAADLDDRTVLSSIGRYLVGDERRCAEEIDAANRDVSERLWDRIVGH
jgi:hypothetical protein